MRACIASGDTSFGRCESIVGVAQPQGGRREKGDAAKAGIELKRWKRMERVTADVGEDEKCRRAADDIVEGTIGRKRFNQLNRGWDGWKKVAD